MIPRLWLLLAAAGFALGLLLGWKLAAPMLQRQRTVAVQAKAQADLAAATTRVIERANIRERTIVRQAEAYADAIQTAEGADAPVPPDVLRSWRVGIDGLRAGPATDAVDHGSR